MTERTIVAYISRRGQPTVSVETDGTLYYVVVAGICEYSHRSVVDALRAMRALAGELQDDSPPRGGTFYGQGYGRVA